MRKKLKILFVASEVAPFAKTGGLADVVGSLPRALKELGHDVRVVMPEYTQKIDPKYLLSLEHELHFRTRVVWRDEYVGVNKLKYNGIINYFIDNKYFFDRESLYENEDRHVQFTYFNRAVLEMLPRIGFQPDIIHLNDWQTAPLSLFLKDNYQQFAFYKNIKTVYTIHNLRHQGIFGREILEDVLGIDPKYWDMGIIRHDNLINFMKMGIMTADLITTVSASYAEEIKDPYYGEGLDYAIRMRANDLYGILNGISYEDFDPSKDRRIYANYNSENLKGKYENKRKLQELMNLPQRDEVPVIGVVSRLDEQKGFDLIIHIIDELMQEDIQLVLLGTGDPRYENIFQEIAYRYPDKMSANIKYDAELAQKIYAGSDIFLMPSKFEPCGLSQLISLRYGTIPIVRETGGLKDTIQSYNEETGEGNGFSFANYNAHDMLYTIKRAINFYHRAEIWNKLIKRGMTADFSWKNSARKYLQLYYQVLASSSGGKVKKEQKEQGEEGDSEKTDLINLNQVSAKELQNLKGIGPALAKRIIDYRNKIGKFKRVEDIQKVKGISAKKLKLIREQLTL